MTGETCSFCNKPFKKGDFTAAVGKRVGRLKGALNTGFSPSEWPVLDEPEFYCKSCFDKQFKKK